MKTITDKKVYQCEFCNKLSFSKGAMVVHETCCKKNPKNWTPCASCKYLNRVKIEIEGTEGYLCHKCYKLHIDPEDGYYECTRTDGECTGSLFRTEFICEKTGKKMCYPRKVFLMSKKKRAAIVSRCDCPMPNECKMFKSDI